MVKPEDMTLDQLLMNAVLFLVQTDQKQAAELLVECELEEYTDAFYESSDSGWGIPYTLVTLSAPHSIQPQLGASDVWEWFRLSDEAYQKRFPLQMQIQQAFEVTLRLKPVLYRTYVQLITESEGDWREHLRQSAQGRRVTNQGRQMESGSPVVVWRNLNFRSRAEIGIAEALERQGLLFFPNCAARLGSTAHRHTKEADFLICYEGKWGILEVDGTAFHQNAAQDHERDRQFRQYGIKVIEHFSGKRCSDDPDEVVKTFIGILQKNG